FLLACPLLFLSFSSSSSSHHLFSFTPPAPSTTYTLSLHDALPIFSRNPGPTPGSSALARFANSGMPRPSSVRPHHSASPRIIREDRKSTRLNSSHVSISYAVFCLKKKKTGHTCTEQDNQHRNDEAQ